jgi:hypothetical protein
MKRAVAGLGCGFVGVLGIRVLAANGAELAGRLLTYSYLFAAANAAVALVALSARGRVLRTAAYGALMLVFFGNSMSGWPAPYEFLPGKFQVAAFESGIDPAGVQAARWIGAHLPRDAKVACDISACSLINGYATQTAFNNYPSIFYAPAFDAEGVELVQSTGIDFVVVDTRMTSQRPVAGQYFERETPEQARMVPFPRGALRKFDTSTEVDRVYDGGPIVIYDVRKLHDA